jgi:hypothetical protein
MRPLGTYDTDHRTSRPVSLADCVAAATARQVGRPLATADPHLLDMCGDEGIAVIALPDSRGRVWSPWPADGADQ